MPYHFPCSCSYEVFLLAIHPFVNNYSRRSLPPSKDDLAPDFNAKHPENVKYAMLKYRRGSVWFKFIGEQAVKVTEANYQGILAQIDVSHVLLIVEGEGLLLFLNFGKLMDKALIPEITPSSDLVIDSSEFPRPVAEIIAAYALPEEALSRSINNHGIFRSLAPIAVSDSKNEQKQDQSPTPAAIEQRNLLRQ